ncbi:MAG: DUF3179 domain-containing protein [Chloroflexi bacterium]|nr:DUF3179 domain-containing protein [Chloroflexota bacterium]
MFKLKRQWSFGIVFVGIFVLAACSGVSGGNEPAADNVSEAVAVEERPSPTPVPPEPTLEPEPEPTETMPAETPTEAAAAEPTATEESSDASEDQIVTEDGLVIFTADDRSDNFTALTRGWNTNWERHTIAYDEILSGGPPRDGIPSIDDPQFISQDDAAAWLAENEPVIAVEINGEARAYPLQVLTWHEIVNDTLGNTPIIITFCPLCNSAIVFEALVNGEPTQFGTSGLLRNSDLIMYDRQTESLWQQFTGEAIVGDQVGNGRLTFLPSFLISFDDFRAAYPDGVILSKETGFNRPYGNNPYVGYDTIGGRDPFLFQGEIDGRLPAVERVVTVSLDEEGLDIAYPLSVLSAVGIINDEQGGRNLAVFHIFGTASALDAEQIAASEDVGATGVFDPVVDGQALTFTTDGELFTDNETGSFWNIVGQAVDGPLAGTQLQPIVNGDHFWFSWAAFKPDTIIYQP